jgi:hypothetical protein
VARRDQTLSAICVPASPDRLESELAANDGTSLLSSYTEASPRPGVAVPSSNLSRLAPVISGSQSADMELVVLTGGLPSLLTEGAVQVGYRMADQADNKIRGWTPPNWLSQVTFAKWTSADMYDAKCCTITDTQKVCVIYWDGTNSRYSKVWNPQTATWGSQVEIRTVGHASDVIVCYPEGRMVALVKNKAYRSDDGGATWTLHSASVFSSDLTAAYTTHDASRAAASPADRSAVYVAAIPGTDSILQCASDDQLTSLVEVDTAASKGAKPSIVALPAGGYLLSYLRAADDYPVLHRLSSAWEQYTDTTAIVIRAAACTDAQLTVEPDGLVWCHYAPTAPGGTVKVAYSVDGGVTWADTDEGALRSLATADLPAVRYATCTASGATFIVGNSTNGTSTVDGAVVVYVLGGWSSLPASVPGWSTARDWTQRSGTGPSTGSGSNATWVPTELPGDNGWTAAGAGTDTLITPGTLRIVTASDTRYFSRATSTTTTPATCSAQFACTVGGSVATDLVILRRWISWVGHEYRMTLRASTTQIRLYDDNASALATVDLDLTTAVQIMMVVASGATSQAWYKRPADTTWTSIWSGSLVDNTGTPTATGGIEWGHRSSSISTSLWEFVTDSDAAVVGQGLETTPAVGRPLTSIPIPLPLETGETGEGPSWLAASTGPGVLGEEWAVDVLHDYPIEHVIPTLSPSPAERWRSTSTAEQVIAWDHAYRTWIGDSIALVVLQASFRRCYLEDHDGSNWVEAGLLDLATGFVSVGAALYGDTLVPASGTDGSRYLHEGELVGGHVIIEADNVARRIAWNTAGSWTATSTTPQARIVLENVDGTEDLTSGATIVWPE